MFLEEESLTEEEMLLFLFDVFGGSNEGDQGLDDNDIKNGCSVRILPN